MTVVIGLKHNGAVWIGADSRVTDNDGTKFDLDSSLDSKIIKLNHFVIGFAGDLSAKSYMESFISTRKGVKSTKITDKNSVMKFFLAFRWFLKNDVGLDESEVSKIEVSWLIATKDRLFVSDEYNAILEFNSFCTIGTGASASRAVLEYLDLYEPSMEPEKKLARAYQVAVRHNASCGGHMEVHQLSTLLK
jgi:ATP-dependent protease HslVU (ClpYQ) peptidase subunit